jgi:hypothetical protein
MLHVTNLERRLSVPLVLFPELDYRELRTVDLHRAPALAPKAPDIKRCSLLFPLSPYNLPTSQSYTTIQE